MVGKPNESYADTNARIEHFIKLLDFKGEIVFINEDRSSIEAYENLEHLGKKNKRLAIKDGTARLFERLWDLGALLPAGFEKSLDLIAIGL